MKSFKITPSGGLGANYLKIALRNLQKNKVYSFINVVGLSIGLCSCIAIFILVNFELSFENFWPKKDQIYHVTSKFTSPNGVNYNGGLSSPIPAAMKSELPDFAQTTAFQVFWTKVHVFDANKQKKYFPEPKGNASPDIIITEPSYFNLFPHKWLIGSEKISLNEPFTVVLTEAKMKKYFGQITPEMAMGRTVIYADSMYAKVTGVVQDLPSNTDMKVNDFISYRTIESGTWRNYFQLDQWTNTNSGSQAFVELPKNANIAKHNKDLTDLVIRHLPKEDRAENTRSLELQPLTNMHYNLNYGSVLGRVVDIKSIYVLMAIAAFLLLMACINFVNLATVQSLERNKEIGVRKLLGGNRAALIKQFLAESFIVVLVSVCISLLFIKPTFNLFSDFIPENLYFNIFQPNILLFLAIITIVTTILSGIYPAFIASKHNPITTLKGYTVGHLQSSILRKILMVFQFTIAQVFILGTVLMISQSKFLIEKDMGIEKVNFTYIELNWQLEEKRKLVLAEKLSNLSEVDNLSLSELAARNGYSTNRLNFKGKKTEVHQKSVDEHFIDVFGLKMVAGRKLMKSDTVKELVVNESFTKEFNFKKPQDAIGQQIDWWDTKGQPMKIPIVGVMKDFHFQSLHNPIFPLMIRTEPNYATSITFKLKNDHMSADDLNAFSKKISALFKEVYPEVEEPTVLKFFDDNVASFYASERSMAKLLNAATAIAILISCLGLFGLTAHTVQKRTKELGIRKVLGASILNILTLISKDFIKFVLLSIVIATPIAYYFMKSWLKNFAFHIEISWQLFAVAGLVTMTIALLTVSYQAIRAAMMNPVTSLKTE